MKRIIALLIVLLLAFYVAWPGWTAWQISSAIKARDAATLERKIDFPGVRLSLRPAAEQKIGEIYDRFQQQASPGAAVIIGGIKKDVIPKIAETALTGLVTPDNLIRVANDGRSLKDSAEQILREQVQKIGLPGLGGANPAGAAGGANPAGAAGGRPNLPGGLGQVIGQIGGRLGLDTKQLPGLGGGPGDVGAAGARQPEPPAQPAPSTGPEAAGSANAQQEKFSLANIKRFSFLGPLGFEIGIAKDKTTNEPDVIAEMRFVGGDWRVTGVRPWKM